MLKRFLILFCLVVLIIACQTTETPKLTDVERQEIADIIKQKSQENLKLNASFNEENFNKNWKRFCQKSGNGKSR